MIPILQKPVVRKGEFDMHINNWNTRLKVAKANRGKTTIDEKRKEINYVRWCYVRLCCLTLRARKCQIPHSDSTVLEQGAGPLRACWEGISRYRRDDVLRGRLGYFFGENDQCPMYSPLTGPPGRRKGVGEQRCCCPSPEAKWRRSKSTSEVCGGALPGDPVVGNLPATARNMSSIPGPGGLHKLRSS